MNTNMTGFRWFSIIFVLWTKVASALKGLSTTYSYSVHGSCAFKLCMHIAPEKGPTFSVIAFSLKYLNDLFKEC